MNIHKAAPVLFGVLALAAAPRAQEALVSPQVRTRTAGDGKVTVVRVAAHFVTVIRLPEPVNSIAVGDPALFHVEHSEREPELVLVKAVTERSAETNLLISTIHGRQFSLLLVSRAGTASPAGVDFLLQYKPAGGFLVEPDAVPFPLVGQTRPIGNAESTASRAATSSIEKHPAFLPAGFATNASRETNVQPLPGLSPPDTASLDDLLEHQETAPLPTLYGERIGAQNVRGDRLRVGISEVIDRGEQVIVLFSAVNTGRHAILLMAPQVQLGGKSKTGKLVKHERWSTAEQLPVSDFRLSRRRIGSGGRADGVVVFERPPYKQSNEQLLLQMAESGAVDRPALAPIGFGVSSFRQEDDYGTRPTK